MTVSARTTPTVINEELRAKLNDASARGESLERKTEAMQGLERAGQGPQ